MCVGAMIVSFGKALYKIELNSIFVHLLTVFSSPGRRPGRAIVLPPASALVLTSALASALVAASALAKC